MKSRDLAHSPATRASDLVNATMPDLVPIFVNATMPDLVPIFWGVVKFHEVRFHWFDRANNAETSDLVPVTVLGSRGGRRRQLYIIGRRWGRRLFSRRPMPPTPTTRSFSTMRYMVRVS